MSIVAILFTNLALAGLMTTKADEDLMGTPSHEHRILVVGKAGNGKSSLCNTLCGSQLFQTGRGMSATTRTLHVEHVSRYGKHMTVVDTPDVTNLNLTPREMEEEVSRWRQATYPYPTTVLLTVRCDVRYTAEEYAIYRQIQKLWGDNSLIEHLVVAFTFGDRQDNDLEEELRTVCPELQNVLRDASHRYVMFNNKGFVHEKEEQVQRLINIMQGSAKRVNNRKHSPFIIFLSRAFAAICVISGLYFAGSLTSKSGPALSFGMTSLATGVGALVLKLWEKS